MKNIINLPYPSFATIMVAPGDHITPKTVLFKINHDQDLETIHIARLLGVTNDKIAKYLRKKIGDKITAGEVLAQKKGIFSSSFVRSPISGEIGKLDLSKGEIGLLKSVHNTYANFPSLVYGKVANIGKSAIEVEIQNAVYQGIRGEGKNAEGILKHMGKAQVGVADSLDDVDDITASVILCKFASEATLVKFSVLGVQGIIVVKTGRDMVLPWIMVDEDIFVKLEKFKDKKVWLRPEEKQVIIIE